MARAEFESFTFDSRDKPPTRFRINRPNGWSLKELKTMLYNQVRNAGIRQIMIISKARITTLESEDLSKIKEQKGIALNKFLDVYASRMRQAQSIIIDAVNPFRNFIEKDLPLIDSI